MRTEPRWNRGASQWGADEHKIEEDEGIGVGYLGGTVQRSHNKPREQAEAARWLCERNKRAQLHRNLCPWVVCVL
jgi:hypothetical protein